MYMFFIHLSPWMLCVLVTVMRQGSYLVQWVRVMGNTQAFGKSVAHCPQRSGKIEFAQKCFPHCCPLPVLLLALTQCIYNTVTMRAVGNTYDLI